MDTNFSNSVAILPCSDPNTGDPVDRLFVSLDTPFTF